MSAITNDLKPMPTPKRSNSPIFWLLFGAGGMLAALLGPALVFITGVGGPTGLGFSKELLSYAHVQGLAHNWIGKIFLMAVVSLFAWHAIHRILCSLHDVGIHKTFGVKLVCYGIAMVITVVAAGALLAV